MKKILMVTSMLFITSMAHAESTIVKKYSSKKQVIAMFANDKETCLENNGEWEEEVCYLSGEDRAEVKYTFKTGKHSAEAWYSLSVSTVGQNLNPCEFKGKAKLVKNTLTAKAESCVVTAKFEDNDTLTISNNGKCQEFCGLGAELDAVGLDRNK